MIHVEGNQNIQLLLDKIRVIDYKYKLLDAEDSFNVFSVLKLQKDEVRLHSRFIAELLDDKGTHQKKSLLCELFLNTWQNEDENYKFDLQSYSTKKEYKNIDILLRNKTHAIIIENKIEARDQEEQLNKYYNKILNEGYAKDKITVIYLTLDGREPDDNTLGNDEELKKKVISLSFKKHITNWVSNCIKESALNPSLRETLKQYLHIIKELTGDTMNENEKAELFSLLQKQDNIMLANSIVKNWDYVKTETEFLFWQDLEAEINKLNKYDILELNKYSKEKILNVNSNIRTKDYWYGIGFKFGTVNETDITFFIERGRWETIYYGLIVVDENNQRVKLGEKHRELKVKLSNKYNINYDLWLCVIDYVKPLGFETFNKDETVKLANDDYRSQEVKEFVSLIELFVNDCKQLLDVQ